MRLGIGTLPFTAARQSLTVLCAATMKPMLGRSRRQHAAVGGDGVCLGTQDADEAMLAIVGDLHLEPDQMRLFAKAQKQINQALSDPVQGGPLSGAGIVQLGDLGGYTHRPGSLECFHNAARYLQGFVVRPALITGNHDLEGADFETDEDNLKAWQQVFQQPHYWAAQAGPLLCIGLSTIRFRSNNFSVHEVYIDDAQLQWFEKQLEQAGQRPVAVFTHAPIMGSGLRAVLPVHVKNRCAWVNHSSNPQAFIQLVHKYPNIRLWFSGHYHLSHNYPDSASVVNNCAFFHTGVIGNGNRDGCRHSRLLEADSEGFRVATLDHEDGSIRTDVTGDWQSAPSIPRSASHFLAGPQVTWSMPSDVPEAGSDPVHAWCLLRNGCLLACHAKLLIQYAADPVVPIGVVMELPGEGSQPVLWGPDGQQVDGWHSDRAQCQAVDVATVGLQPADGSSERISADNNGNFYQIFQQNKWRLRLQREQQQRDAVAMRT